MTTQHLSVRQLEYETSELKLAALIVSEVPNCLVDVYNQGNSIRKVIKIIYPLDYKIQIYKIENDFINKKASANVYLYNRALNQIRDRLRGKENERARNSIQY
jgi:methyl coenzyme M reductase subunit D